MAPTATNPKLTEQGLPTVFRMVGRDDRQGEEAASMIARRWPGARIAVLDDDSVYGKGLAEIVRSELAARKIEVLASASFQSRRPDHANVLKLLREKRIDLAYVAAYQSREYGFLLRELPAAGLKIRWRPGCRARRRRR
jgi:branched-chain amino acid transport system substrate-binding protein